MPHPRTDASVVHGCIRSVAPTHAARRLLTAVLRLVAVRIRGRREAPGSQGGCMWQRARRKRTGAASRARETMQTHRPPCSCSPPPSCVAATSLQARCYCVPSGQGGAARRMGKDRAACNMRRGREEEQAAEHEGQCSRVVARALALHLCPPCPRQASGLVAVGFRGCGVGRRGAGRGRPWRRSNRGGPETRTTARQRKLTGPRWRLCSCRPSSALGTADVRVCRSEAGAS